MKGGDLLMSADDKKNSGFSSMSLDDLKNLDPEKLKGVTFDGESFEDWRNRIKEKRSNEEAKMEHTVTSRQQKSFLNRTRSRKLRSKAPTEHSGFVRIYSREEVFKANAERRFMETKGKYLYVRDDGIWHKQATVLNLMMIWTTKDVENVFKTLDILDKKGNSLGQKYTETPPLTTHNLNVFLCSKLKDMTPQKLTTSTGPIISGIYEGLKDGIKGKCNDGLITRKTEADSKAQEYELNGEIFKYTLDDLLAEVRRVTNERQKTRTAKLKKKKKDASDKADKKKAVATKKAAEELRAAEDALDRLDLSTEEGLKTFILKHPAVSITESDAKELDASSYTLVQTIMEAGYRKGVYDERKNIKLVAETPPDNLNETSVDAVDVESHDESVEQSPHYDIISLVNALPRGSKLTKNPDGTIHVLL